MFVSVFVSVLVSTVLTVRILDLAERAGHEPGAGATSRRLRIWHTGVAEVTARVSTEHSPRLLTGVPAGHRTLPEGMTRVSKKERQTLLDVRL